MLVKICVELDHRYLEQRGKDVGMDERALSAFKNLGYVELTYDVPDDPYEGVATVVAVDGKAVSGELWVSSQ